MIRPLPLAALLALMATPAVAEVESLANYQDAITRLESELTNIEQLYQGEIELGFQRTYEDRVSAGELYYLLGEYERASTMLFGAIEPPGEPRFSMSQRTGYADALYQLGDSLFQLGNYAAARSYFSELLRLPNHGFRTQAISGLLSIADRLDDHSDLDEYYRLYIQVAGNNVPSDVRYVHAKSLFLAKRDAEAVDELTQIPPGDAFYLRARYLVGATFVRAGDLPKALEIFDDVIRQKAIAKEDAEVMELAHMARGRLHYELDQLTDAIDAYGFVGWDSDHLATMLYEVTWTYVRRGQLALRDEKGLEVERKNAASREYELALQQLDDLRLLIPEEEGQADVDLLRGNLELQRQDFKEAAVVFNEILDAYRPADVQLAAMLEDPSMRSQVLQDILAAEEGGLSVDSNLPPVAIKRAAEDPDVAEAIRVFRDIRQSQAELAATEKMMVLLEELLAAANRGERFPQLRSGFARAYTLDNNALRVMSGLAELQAKELAGRTSPRLEELARERRALQARLDKMPKTGEGLEARKDRFAGGFEAAELELYELQQLIDRRRAQLAAIDLLLRSTATADENAPPARQSAKGRLREMRALVDEWQFEADKIRDQLAEAKRDNTVSGGRGAAEASLRNIFAGLIRDHAEEVDTLLGKPSEFRPLMNRAVQLREKQARFVGRLNQAADGYISSVRRVVLEEKGNLALYRNEVVRVSTGASAIREDATTVALEHVRRQLHDVVLRSDVGIIDVAFARKQAQTEKIGRLQRAKSQELTDLNQAYADLTADEAQE